MRAYVFVDDSDVTDERATTLHETGTGELRALGFLTRHLGSVHLRQIRHRSAWHSASSIVVRLFPVPFPQ